MAIETEATTTTAVEKGNTTTATAEIKTMAITTIQENMIDADALKKRERWILMP